VADPVALRSEAWFRFFCFMFRWRAATAMRAMRIARWGVPQIAPGAPLVVFANHQSWWDGVMFPVLAQRLFHPRPIFVPMDAAAHARYGFMKRFGAFPVEQNSARGAVGFLRMAEHILADPHHMLWMNAPGRFIDTRVRPQPISPGLVRLAEIAPGAVFLPLALEYPFWSEPKAELLCAFGEPIDGATLRAMSRDDRAAALGAALHAVMDRLAQDAQARDPARFETLQQGREGMGGIYDLWRRLRAWMGGRSFDPRHDPRNT
jgi:1-acyl-sn-glycerol-3-phosphate acyltransferase